MNGLVEGVNKLLLNTLHRLYSPNMDDLVDQDEPLNPTSIPHNWPQHFDEVICLLNNCIHPSICCSSQELLFGLALTPDYAPPETPEDTSVDLVDTNLTLADMLCMNTYLLQLETTN